MKLFFAWLMAGMVCASTCLAQSKISRTTNNIGLPNRWKIEKLVTDTGLVDLASYNMYAEFNLTQKKISGQAGCNNFFGEVQTGKKQAIKLKNFATTRMACPNIQLESQVLGSMKLITRYIVKEGRLQLLQNNKTIFFLLKLPAQKAVADSKIKDSASLLSGQYRFVRMQSNGISIDFADDSKAYIDFNLQRSQASGKAPCNGFGGQLSVEALSVTKGSVKMEKFISTMIACEELEIEKQLLKMLELADNYEIKGNSVFLKKDTEVLVELEKTKVSDL